MAAFRNYVQKRIRQVESWLALPADEADWQQVSEDCRTLLAEVEREATLTGEPLAVAACQVRGTSISAQKTRRILAECLAAGSAGEKRADTVGNSNRVMTVAEVAARLGVSKEIVYTMCRDGRLPCTRIGRRITVSPEQLRSYQSELPSAVGSLRHLS